MYPELLVEISKCSICASFKFYFLGDWVTTAYPIYNVSIAFPFHKITNFVSEALEMI